MTNYTVDALNLGKFMRIWGIIDNLRLRYEHVGYHGQPLVVVCHALTGNHLTYGTDDYPGGEKLLMGDIYPFTIINF